MSNYQFKYLPQPVTPSPKAPAKKPKGCLRLFNILLEIVLICMAIGLLSIIGGYLYFSHQLASSIDQVVSFQGSGLGGTPRFFDRNGHLLFELTPVEKRQWVTYNQIPPTVINATIAVEDDTFWENPGFDPAAVIAALISNLRNPDQRPVGASTITQQLVRHIAFSYEERIATSYQRKALEIFYAFILTRQRSKEEILEMYLNEIYYGNLAYGIEAASQTYFAKPATELTLAEASLLAGLPQAPLDWDPYTNFAGTKARQEFILDLMVAEGMIDSLTAQVEKGQVIHLAPLIPVDQQAASAYVDTPHFVLYVQDVLERRYGPDALVRNGWQITTSLDLNMQRLAENIARSQMAERAVQYDSNNAAVVILKPSTGEILAMVGSLDYYNEIIDGQFNMTLQPRQPGSSFKPITYVAAMQKGWTTGDVLWDVPIVLDMGGGQTMRPVNYDGRYHGPILLRDALANSYNIPPIQLIRDVGIPTVISTGRTMGIESLKEQAGYYGLALTLGGGEVPLLEMTQAYATLANGGQKPRLTSVLQIVDSAGNVLYDKQRENIPPTNAIDSRIAYIITDILSDNNARAPAMGANSPLRLPFPAAAKTGTTNDFRDNWTLGYTPGVVVGVWSGNTDGRPMKNSSGLSGAAPIWNAIMQTIYADETLLGQLLVNGQPPPSEFPQPNGLEQKRVCLPQGTGGSSCTAYRNDWFIVGGPMHGVGRLGYTPDLNSNPGAWTVAIMPLASDQAQAIWNSQPPLIDGARPPMPILCALNMARPPEGSAIRLMLPVPPFYPDEVRARLWAQQVGYQMAPPTSCPMSIVYGSSGATGNSGSSSSGGSGQSVQTGNQNNSSSGGVSAGISSPTAGQQISGLVPIIGTANFSGGNIQYYKLEIGSGSSPSEWITFGTTHTQPVSGSVLEQLNASGLSPGNYIIRLVLVGNDGNFAATHAVPITIIP